MSAKALGAMVKGMGESCFDDLLPWLMETLASEQSSVDRSGAAQGENGKLLVISNFLSMYGSLICITDFLNIGESLQTMLLQVTLIMHKGNNGCLQS